MQNRIMFPTTAKLKLPLAYLSNFMPLRSKLFLDNSLVVVASSPLIRDNTQLTTDGGELVMTLWLTNIDLGAFLFVAPVREWAICQGGGS